MTTPYEIPAMVAAAYHVPYYVLYRRTRRRETAEPRQVAITLMWEAGCTLKEVARHFGLKNHTTVIYARDVTYERCDVYPDLAEQMERLRRSVGAGSN